MNRGYASASTNRIAEVAGVSVGTLYQYFSGKDAVFDGLICRERAAILDAIRNEQFDPQETLPSKLRRIFSVVLVAMPLGPALLRSLEAVPNAVLRHRVAEAKRDLVVFMRKLLEAHRSEVGPHDLDLAAFLLVNASEGVGANAADDVWGPRLVEELTTLFSAYLVGPPR